MIESNLGGKGLFSLHIWSDRPLRKAKAGTLTGWEAAGRRLCRGQGGALLTSLLLIAFSACDTRALPYQSLMKKFLYRLVMTKSDEDVFSVEVPSSQMSFCQVNVN